MSDSSSDLRSWEDIRSDWMEQSKAVPRRVPDLHKIEVVNVNGHEPMQRWTVWYFTGQALRRVSVNVPPGEDWQTPVALALEDDWNAHNPNAPF